ncbi:ICAM3 protein, partial [Trogon melanurus]|nr:ICAM3 protein [Trogon melanurus]
FGSAGGVRTLLNQVLPAGRLGASLKVWLEPAVPVVEYGKSVLLRVKSTCSDPRGRGGVETSILKRFLSHSPGETEVELQNVTTLNSEIIYFYDCNGREKNTTNLVVYRVPEPPVLEPVRWLPVGQERELVCRVKDAAPIRNLRVTLRRGDEELCVKNFKDQNPDELKTVTVTHRLTARREDHGHNVTCEALLDLQPYSPRLNVTSEPQRLSVYGEPASRRWFFRHGRGNRLTPSRFFPPTEFPEGPKMKPDVHLEVNETASVSCTVGRVFPEARFTLALAGQTLPVIEDGHRATATVSGAEPGRFRLLCNVTVGPVEKQTEATVHVYRECRRRRRRERGSAGVTRSPQRHLCRPQISPSRC